MYILALAAAAAATAQPAPDVQPAAAPAPQPVVAQAAPASTTFLPTNTQLMLSLNSEVSSKKVKEGHTFDLTVLQDVMLGNYIVIPRGTPATGQVTYRTGKGAFGKSAKMEIDMQHINLGGRTVLISGHYRQEGEGNTGATIGTAIAAGVFSAFVTGRSATFRQGQEFRAFTREAIPVVLPAGANLPAVAPVVAPVAVTPPPAGTPLPTTVAQK